MINKEDRTIRELKNAAFETLLFYPGIPRDSWLTVLLREYTEEVVDALGDDHEYVLAELAEWWERMEYEDECTGIERTYKDWAALLRDADAVEYYRTLASKNNED